LTIDKSRGADITLLLPDYYAVFTEVVPNSSPQITLEFLDIPQFWPPNYFGETPNNFGYPISFP